MAKKYKICIISSSRADFGLLTPLLFELKKSEILDVKLIVTGSHLSYNHGYTLNEIEEAGFAVHAKIDIKVDNSSNVGIGKTLARSISSFSEKLNQFSPDLLVILGDRFEILGVATAAMCLNIPIAHIHGGEVTEGSQDDAFRHAITKLSHLHFVCSNVYRNRVIQMGENPDVVFNTGSLGIDNINNTKKIERHKLEKLLNIKFSKTNIMVGYHSNTLTNGDDENVEIMLEDLVKIEDSTMIFTMPNADLGGKTIETKLRQFCAKNNNAYFFENLGMQNYISCLAQCNFLVGNSSSGTLEAPFLGCYTVNLGTRQKGRLQANTILNVTPKVGEIYSLITEHNSLIANQGRPSANTLFGDGTASEKIVSIIESKISKINVRKSFYDIN